MHFDQWWNSQAADAFRAQNPDMDGEEVRPVWDAGIAATLPAATLRKLTVARILEIRDALLPAQGEPFDCVAFAVEIVKAERARAADVINNPDMEADAARFRWLCAHPDWHFIERLCREFVADSSMEFLAELRRVIDARRAVELDAFELLPRA